MVYLLYNNIKYRIYEIFTMGLFLNIYNRSMSQAANEREM